MVLLISDLLYVFFVMNQKKATALLNSSFLPNYQTLELETLFSEQCSAFGQQALLCTRQETKVLWQRSAKLLAHPGELCAHIKGIKAL